MHARRLVDEREVGAERVADLRLEDPLEDIAMRLQVGLGRSHIEPVARQRDPVDGPLLRELREDLALDRDRAVGWNELERLRLEHVQTRVDQVGVDLLRPGLLEEALDPTVVREPDEPVAARIGNRGQQDRRLRARRAVEAHELREIGLAQRVAVQREEAPLELASGEGDRAAGSERLVLDRVLECEALVPLAERRLNLVGQVSARDDPALDAVPREVLERVGEERPVDEREHVLARPVGERPEPRALPSHEDDRRKAHPTWRPMPS